MQFNSTIARSQESVLQTNKVIRNTYILLSMTLVFSAIMAAVSTMLVMPPITYLVTFGASILLLWLVLPRYANSTAGVGIVFLITGLLGFGLGPMLSMYLQLANGATLIMTALGGTGVIFLTLSGYALTTRKDFSFMGGFLMVGLVVAIAAIIANLFLNIPALSLAISAAVIMFMSGFILFDTSRIIHGGETNYVIATIGLYISILNIFVHLLNLLGALSGDD
jgi:modulator of FtsH protease